MKNILNKLNYRPQYLVSVVVFIYFRYLVNYISDTQNTIQWQTNVINLDSLHQGTDPPAKNRSQLLNSQQRKEEELKQIITSDKMARKNKGIYLPLYDEARTKVHQRNQDRKQQVNNICTAKNLRKNISLENMKKIKRYTNVAVDDKHKLLYCYVPKVACTSWKVKLSLMGDKAGGAVLNTHPSPVDTRRGSSPNMVLKC